MNLKTNFKTGISLVALVVTIVVLIIMSGAVILSFNKTNILDQAEFAAERQKVAFLQEKITMEKQNEMLSRFETTHSNVATQNKTVTVQELLNVTEEDALNIVEANSIPANMPAGTYYELDSNRYSSRLRNQRTNLALLSRGIDRENDLVSDTYVVSENFVVYYIIDGKTGAPTQEINDNKVVELLMNIMQTDGPTSPEAQNYAKQLKETLFITNIESNNLFDFMVTLYDENDNQMLFYFYTIDRMYVFNSDGTSLVYIDKENKTSTYEYAQKAAQVLKELKILCIGKTKTELLEKYNNGTLNSYVLENCQNITYIEINSNLYIENLNFIINNIEYDFDNANTLNLIFDESGKCINIHLTAGA